MFAVLILILSPLPSLLVCVVRLWLDDTSLDILLLGPSYTCLLCLIIHPILKGVGYTLTLYIMVVPSLLVVTRLKCHYWLYLVCYY